jgi:Flp pilus assembly protein TadG
MLKKPRRFRKAGASARAQMRPIFPWARFARRAGLANESGLAAVEFALILPLLITLFFGVVEVSLMLSARATVTSVASVTADLVAQKSTVTASDMTNVFTAASAILFPSSLSKATIEVYSIVDDNNSTGKVAWSCKKIGTAAATTGPTTIPKDAYGNNTTGGDMIKAGNLDANGTPQYGGSGSVIIGKITYSYSSPTSQLVAGTTTMTNIFYARPRRVASIAAPTSCS